MINRRRLIKILGATGTLAGLSGCLAPSTEASFTYQPANPVAGEPIVFDASDAKGEAYEWEFKDTDGNVLNKEGEKVTIRTDGPGAFISTLRVADSVPTNNPGLCFLGGGAGIMCSVDEMSKRVYIRDPSENDKQVTLQINTERVNLLLKGSETNVSSDEAASLQFSATNLIGNEELTVQLILETPSGLSVTSVELVESGAGQYTSEFVLDPSEAKGFRINITPHEAGQYTVTGHAVYYFGDDTKERESRSVQIPITVTS